MARPQKNSCDYFSHDNDMRNHRKVKSIRNKFGIQGYAIWSMLLEYLTGIDGNEFEYSDFEFELISGDFGVSVTEIREVVDYCVKLEMLFNDNGFIYSESLNERLAPVYKKRGVAKDRSEKQKRINGKFSNNNDTNGVSVTEIPQSKVNESKEDKNKVNESKKTKEISKEILPSDLENEKLRLEIERLNQALEEKNKKVSTKGGAAKPKKVSWLDLKEMELPEIYNEEEFRETWQSWCDFKQSRKESVLTDKGLELWFKKLETLSSRDLSISIQIVNESIANNWQGIFELKNQKSYAASKPNSQKSTTPYGAVGGVNSQGRGMFLIPLDDSAESSQSNDCIEVEGFYQSEL